MNIDNIFSFALAKAESFQRRQLSICLGVSQQLHMAIAKYLICTVALFAIIAIPSFLIHDISLDF